MSEEESLPKGVGRVPQWWMEITPHNTLDLDEDERRRRIEYEEAVMYAKYAAEDDYQQRYGEGGYDPSQHGPGGPGGAGWEGGKGGYQRGPGKQWEEGATGPEGRQFKPGQAPPGYQSGQGGYYDPSRFAGDGKRYSGVAGAGSLDYGQGELNKTGYGQYGRDENINWEKPAWTQIKLRSTGTGSAIRKGDYQVTEKPITQATSRPIPSGKVKVGEQAAEAAPVAAPAPAPAIATSTPKEEPVGEDKAEARPSGGIGRLVKRIRRKKVKKRKSDIQPENAPSAEPAAQPTLKPTPKPVATPPKPQAAEPSWAKRREQVDAASEAANRSPTPAAKPAAQGAPAQPEEEEIIEEEYYDEEVVEEEYDDEEEIIEEIIVEDEDGNEIAEEGIDGSTHDVTQLQKALAKKANEIKLLQTTI